MVKILQKSECDQVTYVYSVTTLPTIHQYFFLLLRYQVYQVTLSDQYPSVVRELGD